MFWTDKHNKNTNVRREFEIIIDQMKRNREREKKRKKIEISWIIFIYTFVVIAFATQYTNNNYGDYNDEQSRYNGHN